MVSVFQYPPSAHSCVFANKASVSWVFGEGASKISLDGGFFGKDARVPFQALELLVWREYLVSGEPD